MKRSRIGESTDRSNPSKRPGDGADAPQRKSHHQHVSERDWARQISPEHLARQESERKGREWTLSVAIPSSALKSAQSKELRTHLIGRIARMLAVHTVDEVVIYVDNPYELQLEVDKRHSVFFSRILQYMETPPYLRKDLFPMSPDLKFCGLLPPLETPCHMRRDDASMYREGVCLNSLCRRTGKSEVNVGLGQPVVIDRALKPGTRVTVRLGASTGGRAVGVACSPSEPRVKYGLYWGFQTRVATSLSRVFTEGPHAGGYDAMVGSSQAGGDAPKGLRLPEAKHMLVVFGGEGGIESAVENDEELGTLKKDARGLFDMYVSFGGAAGTRELRLEEELMVGLTTLGMLRG